MLLAEILKHVAEMQGVTVATVKEDPHHLGMSIDFKYRRSQHDTAFVTPLANVFVLDPEGTTSVNHLCRGWSSCSSRIRSSLRYVSGC